MKIYLAGKVPKGDDEEKLFDNWRLRYKEHISSFLEAEFIDPYDRELDESNFKLVFGYDCNQIKNSDLLIFYAEEPLGVGTSQEMVIAKHFKKPVIVVLPKNTQHRRNNLVFRNKEVEDWIHPFIFNFADFIIEDIKDFSKIIDKISTLEIKDISVIDSSIEYFNLN